MARHLLTKSNALIEAGYRLSLTEIQIVLYGISLINPVKDDFPLVYRVDIKSFAEMFKRKHGDIYMEVKEAIFKRFWERDFSYIMENGKVATSRWLTDVIHEDKAGFLELRFNPTLKPYLHQLKNRFTTFYIDQVAKFKSAYSVRFYEYSIMNLNKSKRNTCKFSMLLSDLKKRLELGERYKRFCDLRLRVLSISKREINKHSDINFSYKVIKLGRSPYEIEFTVSRKNQDTKTTERTVQTWLRISTIEKAKKIVKRAGTGWDIHEIEHQFHEYKKTKGVPRNIDAAFIGFVEQKIKKHP